MILVIYLFDIVGVLKLCNTSSTTKTTHIEIEQKEVISELFESIVLENYILGSVTGNCLILNVKFLISNFSVALLSATG